MAGIPQNFTAISNVLASYDFVDISSGTGYINFYAGNTVDLELLSNFTFYSDAVSFVSAGFSGAVALQLDTDFDVVLNRPLDLSGTGIVNVPIGGFSGGGTWSSYVIVKLRKWDGVTETEICNNQSSTSTISGGGSTAYFMKAVDLTIPLTHFKKGETLRLTVESWAGSLATGTVFVGNDPMNRSTGWDASGVVPSKFMFQCPVRLNL